MLSGRCLQRGKQPPAFSWPFCSPGVLPGGFEVSLGGFAPLGALCHCVSLCVPFCNALGVLGCPGRWPCPPGTHAGPENQMCVERNPYWQAVEDKKSPRQTWQWIATRRAQATRIKSHNARALSSDIRNHMPGVLKINYK